MKHMVFSVILFCFSCGVAPSTSLIQSTYQIIDEVSSSDSDSSKLYSAYVLLQKYAPIGIRLEEFNLPEDYFVARNQQSFDGIFYIINQSSITKKKVGYHQDAFIVNGQSLLGYLVEHNNTTLTLNYDKTNNTYKFNTLVFLQKTNQQINHSIVESSKELDESDKVSFMKNLISAMVKKIELPTQSFDSAKAETENLDNYQTVKNTFILDMMNCIDILPQDLSQKLSLQLDDLVAQHDKKSLK